jgi:hypothetical protein
MKEINPRNEHYQRLRGIAWDRLASTVDTMRQQAKDKSLTDETLASLLAEESRATGRFDSQSRPSRKCET